VYVRSKVRDVYVRSKVRDVYMQIVKSSEGSLWRGVKGRGVE